jgi:hypothetical protein
MKTKEQKLLDDKARQNALDVISSLPVLIEKLAAVKFVLVLMEDGVLKPDLRVDSAFSDGLTQAYAKMGGRNETNMCLLEQAIIVQTKKSQADGSLGRRVKNILEMIHQVR